MSFSVSENLHYHVLNPILEVIIGASIVWVVTHNFWVTVAAGVLVAAASKVWRGPGGLRKV